MSILSKIFGGRPNKHDNNVFDFVPKPGDMYWKAITNSNVAIIQKGFIDTVETANLESYNSTEKLPQDVIDIICQLSNETAHKLNIGPAILIILAHQYVDADQLMRQMYRYCWVSKMVARSNFSPPPEAYMDYIKETYFGEP
jgi:hypothetical protein